MSGFPNSELVGRIAEVAGCLAGAHVVPEFEIDSFAALAPLAIVVGDVLLEAPLFVAVAARVVPGVDAQRGVALWTGRDGVRDLAAL